MTGFLRRFLRAEDGSSTIEFVILFPLVFGLVLSSIELGVLLTRQAMLDRGIDLTVRDLRLGGANRITHDQLKASICSHAIGLIPDCVNQLRLEMVPMDPRAWTPLRADVACVNRGAPATPVDRFSNGAPNRLMMLRACAVIDPYFSANVLGFPNVAGGSARGLVSTAAFVVEPS